MSITIAGTKPTGSCASDGQTLWATRRFDDGAWYFTEYDGWLIASETSTTDKALAQIIGAAIVERIDA